MFEKKKASSGFALEYETERLVLRVLSAEYLREVLEFQLRNRELFEKYEPTLPENFYTASHQQLLLKYEFQAALKMSTVRFYVFQKDNPTKIIGTVCLHNIQKFAYSCCEIGYKFDQEYHHQGYATESLEKVISVAFEQIGLHRMFARIMPENLSSIRLLKSLGFMEEGVEHDSIQIRGKWEDHLRFAKLNPSDGTNSQTD